MDRLAQIQDSSKMTANNNNEPTETMIANRHRDLGHDSTMTQNQRKPTNTSAQKFSTSNYTTSNLEPNQLGSRVVFVSGGCGRQLARPTASEVAVVAREASGGRGLGSWRELDDNDVRAGRCADELVAKQRPQHNNRSSNNNVMTPLRESHLQWSNLADQRRPRKYSSSSSSSMKSSLSSSIRRHDKVLAVGEYDRDSSPTTTINNNNDYNERSPSSSQSSGEVRSQKQRDENTTTQRQQQLMTGRRDPHSKSQDSLSTLAPYPMLLLQPCLALFALSLFLSNTIITTTTLVNGIRLQPEGKEKFYWSGEQFVITCQNNNNIKNVKIRWTGPDNNNITENRKERIHVESNGHRLVVSNAQLDRDDGQYTCIITEGQRARESAEFTLKVLKEINFKNTAKHVTLRAGNRGRLDCYVEFDPSVTSASVTWLKDQQPVDLLNDSSIRVQDYDSARQVSSLSFVPAKREHEGEYICQATAVTPNLSKIIDHKIQVETQFGPTFDAGEQTIWVESIQAIQSRLQMAGANQAAPPHHSGAHQQQQQPQAPLRNTFSAQRNRGNRLRLPQQPQQELSGEQTNNSNVPSEQQVVRVELKCTCQANPDANILWFADSSNIAASKGSPEQVVEEPVQVRSGHNVTSTLVVAYNLDPNWSHRREKYKCSASNALDTANKFFTIEQGNPPPAFLVGQHTSYSAQTTEFNFTLLGPIVAPAAHAEPTIASLASIVPPIDSFRIRAESGPAPTVPIMAVPPATIGAAAPASHLAAAHHQTTFEARHHSRRQPEQSVQWAYALGPDVSLPLNMSVKLGNLPSGVQHLFLEAHNAVGYSPNSTYLGQFNLVSSAHSTAFDTLSGLDVVLLLLGQLIAVASHYLARTAHC